MNLKETFLYFFVSKGNIAGMSAVALILLINDLLILLPGEHILPFWQVMVVAVYALCFWYYQYQKPKWMREKGITVAVGFWADLEDLVARRNKELPLLARQRLLRVNDLCRELADFYPSLDADHQYTIRHMISDYIPNTLENYLHLPRSIRNEKKDIAQKAAEQLDKQLQLLEESLLEIVTQAAELGLHQSKINTRFLQQRFDINPKVRE